MANKKQLLKQLADYFAEKGKFLSAAEYKAAEDAPMRFVIAKRPFGSWSRVASMIKTNYPEEWAKMNAPIVEEAPKPAPKKATKAATKPKATKGK